MRPMPEETNSDAILSAIEEELAGEELLADAELIEDPDLLEFDVEESDVAIEVELDELDEPEVAQNDAVFPSSDELAQVDDAELDELEEDDEFDATGEVRLSASLPPAPGLSPPSAGPPEGMPTPLGRRESAAAPRPAGAIPPMGAPDDRRGTSGLAPLPSAPPPKAPPPDSFPVPAKSRDGMPSSPLSAPPPLSGPPVPGASAPLGVSAPPPPSASAPPGVPPAPAPPSVARSQRPSAAGNATLEYARIRVRELTDDLGRDPSAEHALRLHLDLARLAESPLKDHDRAAQHYAQALKLQPESLVAVRGLRRVRVGLGSFAEALPLFDLEARLTASPTERAALAIEKAKLLEHRLGDKEGALETYRVARDLDNGNLSVHMALSRHYEERKDVAALDRTLEELQNGVHDDPKMRAALVSLRGRNLEANGEADRATELYETALRLDPETTGALDGLKRCYHRAGRWRDLATALTLEASQSRDPRVRAEGLARVAELHVERLGSRDEAITALERARDAKPDDPAVLERLAQLYRLDHRYELLVGTLKVLAEMTRDTARVPLLHEIGRVCRENLNLEKDAIHWYEAAQALAPTHLPTLHALAALYERHGQWDALLKMRLAEAENTTDGKRRASSYAAVADLCEIRMTNVDAAIEHYGRALSADPDHAPSFKALTRLLATQQRYRDLVTHYARAVERAETVPAKITYLFKIGLLYEDRIDDANQASKAYQQILELEPDHLGAVHALQRSSERAGKTQQLLHALDLEIERSADAPERAVPLIHRAGEILKDRLGDHAGALVRFKEALDLDPGFVPSLKSLGQLYQAAGRWDDLLDILEQELALVTSPQDAALLLDSMARIARDKIGDEPRAVAFHRRALGLQPGDGHAMRAVVTSLTARSRFEELVSVYEERLATTEDPAERADLLTTIGKLQEERLGDPDSAALSYGRACAAKVDHRGAIDALNRLHAQAEEWTALSDTLKRETDTTADRRLALSAALRQGDVWAKHLDDPVGAIEAYERVLQTEPGHLGALFALESLYRSSAAYAQLARVYAIMARIFRDNSARVAALRALAHTQHAHGVGTQDDLISTYEALLSLSPNDVGALRALESIGIARGDLGILKRVDERMVDLLSEPMSRARHYTRLGETLEALGDPNAIKAYRAALDRDPKHPSAVRGLSRTAQRGGDPQAIVNASRREADASTDPISASRALVRGAKVAGGQLGDLRAASVDLARALELDPDSAEAAEQLTKVLRALEDEPRLADLLARAAGAATVNERVAALLLDVARIQADRLDNRAAAIGSLNRVLRTMPDHVPTLSLLAEYYRRDGQWSEATRLLLHVVEIAPDRVTLRDSHLALAEIADKRLRDPARAVKSLNAVLAIDGQHVVALSRLTDIYEQAGNLDHATETARRLFSAARNEEEQSAALLRMARLERSRGHDLAALESLRRAVAMDGPKSEAALEYRALITSPAGWAEYVESLRRYLATREDGEPKAPAYLEIARVQFDQLNDAKAGIQTLRVAVGGTKEIAIRRELASRLRSAGKHHDALVELSRLLEEDATRAKTWHELTLNYKEMHLLQEARIAASGLVLLGAAEGDTLEAFKAFAPRPAKAHPETLTEPVLAKLGAASPAQHAATELLRALDPGLSKLFPADLDDYRLSTRDRLKSGHPVRDAADRVATILGLGSFEIYLHNVRTKGVAVELGSTPSIMLPQKIAELPEPSLVFAVARPLVKIARGFSTFAKLTPHELEVLLASAGRIVKADFRAGLTSEDMLDEQSKRLHKSLSRRNRKVVEDFSKDYVNAPRIDFADWVFEVNRTASQVALLIADDLPSCVDALPLLERDLSAHSGKKLYSTPMVSDLMRFWVSDAAIRLRRHVGLLPERTRH